MSAIEHTVICTRHEVNIKSNNAKPLSECELLLRKLRRLVFFHQMQFFFPPRSLTHGTLHSPGHSFAPTTPDKLSL